MRSIDGEVGQSDRCPRPQGPAVYATNTLRGQCKLARYAKASHFGKDSLRPEGDVALATKGGRWHPEGMTERASSEKAKIEAQRYDGSWGAAPYRCACVLFCQRPEGVALPQEADDQICRTAAEHGQNGVRLELAQGNESGGEDQDADPVDRRQCERTIREADQFQDG